jgi:hypothetical protein
MTVRVGRNINLPELSARRFGTAWHHEVVTDPRTSPLGIQAPIVWPDVDGLPVLAASHFVLQGAVHSAPDVNDVILTVGYLPPPLLQGDAQEQREAAGSIQQLMIRPLARFSVPVGKAAELGRLLTTFVQALQEAAQQTEHLNPGTEDS